MEIAKVLIQLEEGATLPRMATKGSAGYDLCSAETVDIEPGKFAKVSTGVKLSIPEGLEAQIRPRSGLSARFGVTVLNAPGTIDSDYRGEVCVLLINHGNEIFKVESGMRIAQLVFGKVCSVQFQLSHALSDTERGEGGFGSTGN